MELYGSQDGGDEFYVLFYHRYFKTNKRVHHMITLLVFIDINKNEGKLIIQ